MWLWERVFWLLSNYDLFLYWPTDDPIAAMATASIPMPDELEEVFRRVVVSSAEELRTLVES